MGYSEREVRSPYIFIAQLLELQRINYCFDWYGQNFGNYSWVQIDFIEFINGNKLIFDYIK